MKQRTMLLKNVNVIIEETGCMPLFYENCNVNILNDKIVVCCTSENSFYKFSGIVAIEDYKESTRITLDNTIIDCYIIF